MPDTDATKAPAEPAGDDTAPGGDPGKHDPTADGASMRRRRIGLLALTAFVVLTLDVVSKVAVVANLTNRQPVRTLGGLVYLTETRNTGAAFSFAEGATVIFSLIVITVIGVILHTASRLRSTPWAVSLGLILGGAAGNLVDRLVRSPGPLRGGVVDWISVLDPNGAVWPIFNLADAGIVSGAALALVLAMFGFEINGRRGRDAPEPPDGSGQSDDQGAAGQAHPDHGRQADDERSDAGSGDTK